MPTSLVTMPTMSELLALDITRLDTEPCSNGKALAFKIVSATCPFVDGAFDQMMAEMIELLEIKPEDSAMIDSIICRAKQRIKQTSTEPLRRALVYACHQWSESVNLENA